LAEELDLMGPALKDCWMSLLAVGEEAKPYKVIMDLSLSGDGQRQGK
jgi:hypothetical protein